jgi:hypothetical protein
MRRIRAHRLGAVRWDEGREDDPRQRSVNEASTNSTPSQIRAWRAKA